VIFRDIGYQIAIGVALISVIPAVLKIVDKGSTASSLKDSKPPGIISNVLGYTGSS
jgi:hypothetical protein